MIQLKLMFSSCRLPAEPPAEQIKLPLSALGNNPASHSNIINIDYEKAISTGQ
ncbi:hypothetical protein QUF70_16255 [Desulfobacterales bacterium HSG17]|nr:hypothetical protein [Desulfobacterales bacterium HSG17]